MYSINLRALVPFLQHVAYDMHEPVMIWGGAGTGKSEAVAEMALRKIRNGVLVDVRLSQYDSVDLRGFPGVDGTQQQTVWYAPSTLPFKGNPKFDENGPTITLFLDEINAAVPATAAVAYQLINDRAVGEHVLMDNVVVVAAGNRDGDGGVTNRMPAPLANRFTHVEVVVDVDAWCEWATRKGLPPIGPAFLQFRRTLLSTYDAKKPAKAFASPRTWFKALRYYDAAAMPMEVKQAAMAGAIGEGPSAEFWGFVDVWTKVPKIKDILKDPTGITMPEELSMRYATAVSVSGHMDAQNIDALYSYLQRMDPDYVILAWRLALQRDQSLFAVPAFARFSKQYKAVFV